MSRKHRTTGKRPPGGPRAGAGRPKGIKDGLEHGEVKALRVSRLRVPAGASPEAAELADASLQRLVDVMLERVDPFMAGHVLKSAIRLREEVCGPIAQKHEHTGADGGPLTVEIRTYAAEPEPAPNVIGAEATQ